MWFPPSPIRIRPCEINRPIKRQAAVRVDVNVQRLIIRGCVDQADITRLHKVVGHHNVFLVGGDLDVVGADSGLVFVRVVQALDVVEVGDVKGGDVVGGCDGHCRVVNRVSDICNIGTSGLSHER